MKHLPPTGLRIGATQHPVIFHRGTKGLFRKKEVLYYRCKGMWRDGTAQSYSTGFCDDRGTEGEMLEHLVLFHETPMEEADKYLKEAKDE